MERIYKKKDLKLKNETTYEVPAEKVNDFKQEMGSNFDEKKDTIKVESSGGDTCDFNKKLFGENIEIYTKLDFDKMLKDIK